MAWLFGWWLCLLCGILGAGPREWFLLFENVGEKVYKERGLPLLKLIPSSARSPSSLPLVYVSCTRLGKTLSDGYPSPISTQAIYSFLGLSLGCQSS